MDKHNAIAAGALGVGALWFLTTTTNGQPTDTGREDVTACEPDVASIRDAEEQCTFR